MKRQLWIILFIVVSFLAACSPAAPTRAPQAPEAQKAPGQAAAEQPAYPSAAAAGPIAGLPAEAAQPAGTPAPAGGGNSALQYAPSGSQLVIKDAQLDLLVRDTTQALSRVTLLTGDLGGYIISSQTWFQDSYMYATLRLGIPTARFEAALNELRGLGLQVLRENAQGQDVTDQYVDLQSRLTNLEATAARVREFLKDAKTIEESLKINAQLAELEAQIEQVKGQMHYYEGRSAYSTVTVNLVPQYPTPTPTMTPTPLPTPTATPPWNPGETFQDAGTVFTRQFQTLVDGLIWVGVAILPWLLLLALAALLVRGVARKAMFKLK